MRNLFPVWNNFPLGEGTSSLSPTWLGVVLFFCVCVFFFCAEVFPGISHIGAKEAAGIPFLPRIVVKTSLFLF